MASSRFSKWFKILSTTASSWNDDGAFKHSAAVSFYTLFSLAPITIIALAIAGFVFGKEAATKQFSAQMNQLVGKGSAEMIQHTVASSAPQTHGWTSTIIGIGILVVGATTVFGQLQDSLNSIWKVKAKPSRSGWVVLLITRLISFAMVLTVGFLLLISLILTTALSALVEMANGRFSVPPQVLQAADLIVALGVITVLFAMIFKVMPDVRIPWREVWLGAFGTSFLFSIGRVLIALYLSHSTVASAYGAAGSLVALLVWIYYSCAILFFGAEFIRAYSASRGVEILPKETAVRVREEVVETDDKAPAT
jgi:membrane protein